MSRSNRRQKRGMTRSGSPQRPHPGRSGAKDPVVSNESNRVEETPVMEQGTATDQPPGEGEQPPRATDQPPVMEQPHPMDEPPSVMPDWVIEQAREQGIEIGERPTVIRESDVEEPAVTQERAEVDQIAYGSPDDDGILTRPGDSNGNRSVAEVEAALERQRAENAELRRRLGALEALAEERADQIRDLRRFLRLLQGARKADHGARTIEPVFEPFVWSGEITLEDTTP